MTQIARQDLVDLLRGALGDEKARRSIDEAAVARKLHQSAWLEETDALAVLADLATRTDLVGVAAGLAHRRLELRLARHASVDARDRPPEASASRDQDRHEA